MEPFQLYLHFIFPRTHRPSISTPRIEIRSFNVLLESDLHVPCDRCSRIDLVVGDDCDVVLEFGREDHQEGETGNDGLWKRW